VVVQVCLAIAWACVVEWSLYDWFWLLPSAIFALIAAGVLLRQAWPELVIRLVHWPLLVISGPFFFVYIIEAITLGDDWRETVLLGMQAAASAWTLAWLGDFRTLAHFGVKHLLAVTAAVAVTGAVIAQMPGPPDDKLTAALTVLLEIAALVQLRRSLKAFGTPGAIGNRWQSMGHAVALCVLWVFPVAFLIALTVGMPVPFGGWMRGLRTALISPLALAFYVLFGGWVVLLVLVAMGLWIGNGWWSSYQAACELASGDAPPVVHLSPRFFRSVLALIALVFVVAFVGLIVAVMR
jgi:hypothetical protein